MDFIERYAGQAVFQKASRFREGQAIRQPDVSGDDGCVAARETTVSECEPYRQLAARQD